MGTIGSDTIDPTQGIVRFLNTSREVALSDVPHETHTEIVPALLGSVEYTFRFLTGSLLPR